MLHILPGDELLLNMSTVTATIETHNNQERTQTGVPKTTVSQQYRAIHFLILLFSFLLYLQ